jgi:hypothetical protein
MATVTFTTKLFETGKYKVAVGLTHALLHLNHPSFDRENAYQATLAKERWSEKSKSHQGSHLTGEVKVSVGVKVANFLGLGAKGEAAKERKESAEQNVASPYPLITPTPTGWEIGTELGDPRSPMGTLPDGLEGCLNGEYFSGRNGEVGEGRKAKDGSLALCSLRPNQHGNDPHITATLLGVSGSLKVAITSPEVDMNTASILDRRNEAKQQEETLRKAFIDICIHRATSEHARTGTMLSGEFYLSQHEIHAPKLPQRELKTTRKSDLDEQATAIDSEN